jgi:predicted transposase YbfD/YdcC
MPRNLNKKDYSKNFPSGFEIFKEIEDPRNGGHTLHHFGEIIFMAFVCILCGVKSYELMEEYCELRIEWFKKWISLPNGIPCYNTFSRVFEAIDPGIFSQCIVMHLQQAGVILSDEQIAIDGKALRGSRTKDNGHIHAVSAWACEKGITLAQSFVGEKSNEITAIPELLKMLNLKGAVVSIDAMGTQCAIAKQIVDGKGDYVLCVKGNQGNLHHEVMDQFDYAACQLDGGKLENENWSYTESIVKKHGRNERRQTVVCHYLDWMDPEIRASWKNLGSIVMVSRDRDHGGEKSKVETHYYITSLSDCCAEKIQKYIRNHWLIENSCHWVLDTLFREDHNQTRKRNAAKNLGTMRRIGLNLLKQAPDNSKRARPKSLPKKQLRMANDESYLESPLSLV